MTAQPAGPYAAVLPRDERPGQGYRSIAEHLADALGDLADDLAAELAARLGPGKTRELAKAIEHAIAKAITDAGEDAAVAALDHAAELYRQQLGEQVEAEPGPPLSYRCAEPGCTAEFPVDPDMPLDAHEAYELHLAEHDADWSPSGDED